MPDHEYTTADTNSTDDSDTLSAPLETASTDTLSSAGSQGSEETAVGLDDDIAHLIRRAHQRASATFMAVLADHNLTPAQYFALIRLREKGEVSQNLLGRMAAMDPATIQGVVKRLGQRGLINRVPDQRDRRRMRLHLTDEGTALVDGLRAGIEKMSEKILAPLSAEERLSFRALLKRIV